MDTSLPASVSNKFTSSSIDIANCFAQMVQFWKRLGMERIKKMLN
jgi:hypothetical protein